jgi:hypothetical protein
MNRTAAANALNKIAEGIVELGLALEDIPRPVAVDAPLPSFDELPPEGFDDAPRSAPAAPQDALGLCPVHRTAWTVKAGGVSKAGKEYPPFWRCAQKDPNGKNGYCEARPNPAWTSGHPIGTAA